MPLAVGTQSLGSRVEGSGPWQLGKSGRQRISAACAASPAAQQALRPLQGSAPRGLRCVGHPPRRWTFGASRMVPCQASLLRASQHCGIPVVITGVFRAAFFSQVLKEARALDLRFQRHHHLAAWPQTSALQAEGKKRTLERAYAWLASALSLLQWLASAHPSTGRWSSMAHHAVGASPCPGGCGSSRWAIC